MGKAEIIVAVTGASGSVLARRALIHLFEQDVIVHLVISEAGRKVYHYEIGETIEDTAQNAQNVIFHKNDDLFAPIASGSFDVLGMVIVPCSITTASKIANGIGDNLICRAASVCIKEKTPLVVVPRETPLSSIALANLLTLSQNGAFIMPPVPSFYDKKVSLDDITDAIAGRILSKLGVKNSLYAKWGDSL